MKSRILVAVVGVPLILLVVLWAPIWVFAVFLAMLSAIAAWELMKCVGALDHTLLWVAAVICAAFSVGFAFFNVYIYGELVVVYAMLVFSYAVFRGGEVKFQQVMAALFAMFVVPYAFADGCRWLFQRISSAAAAVQLWQRHLRVLCGQGTWTPQAGP